MAAGIVLSLIGTIFHVSFMVPRRYCACVVKYYYTSLTAGAIFGGIVIEYFRSFFGQRLGLPVNLTTLLAGIILGITWAIACFTYIQGTELIGLSRATALKNYTAVIGLLIGIIGFGEFQQMSWFMFDLVLVGCLVMMGAGAVLAHTLPAGQLASANKWRGILYSLVAAVFFAIYATEVKLVAPRIVTVDHIPLATAWGGFLGAGALLYFTKGKKGVIDWFRMPAIEHCCAVASGFLWLMGTYCMTAGIQLAGIGIAWAVTPFGTVFSVLIGLKIFHEIEPYRQRTKLRFGIIGSLASVILLLFIFKPS